MERIDDQALAGIVGVQILQAAHQEVAGEVDAFGANAGAARHLDVDQRHRDRNALLPIHHLVEAAVARVVELLAVAGESKLAKQVPIDRIDARGERRVVSGILRDEMERRIAHLLEAIEIGPGSRRGYSIRATRNAGAARSGPGRSAASAICSASGFVTIASVGTERVQRVEGERIEARHDQLRVGAQLGLRIGVGDGDAAQSGAARRDQPPARILDRHRSPRDQIAAAVRAQAVERGIDTDPDAACCARSDRRRRSPERACAGRRARARPRSRASARPTRSRSARRRGRGANEIRRRRETASRPRRRAIRSAVPFARSARTRGARPSPHRGRGPPP